MSERACHNHLDWRRDREGDAVGSLRQALGFCA